MYFFFFQAEDGIRDGRVTGVQTCALPISTGATRTMGWNDLIGMRLDQYDILDELGRGGSSRVYHAYDTAAKRDVAIKVIRSEEHTSELQSPVHLVCRLLLEKKKQEVLDIL